MSFLLYPISSTKAFSLVYNLDHLIKHAVPLLIVFQVRFSYKSAWQILIQPRCAALSYGPLIVTGASHSQYWYPSDVCTQPILTALFTPRVSNTRWTFHQFWQTIKFCLHGISYGSVTKVNRKSVFIASLELAWFRQSQTLTYTHGIFQFQRNNLITSTRLMSSQCSQEMHLALSQDPGRWEQRKANHREKKRIVSEMMEELKKRKGTE